MHTIVLFKKKKRRKESKGLIHVVCSLGFLPVNSKKECFMEGYYLLFAIESKTLGVHAKSSQFPLVTLFLNSCECYLHLLKSVLIPSLVIPS